MAHEHDHILVYLDQFSPAENCSHLFIFIPLALMKFSGKFRLIAFQRYGNWWKKYRIPAWWKYENIHKEFFFLILVYATKIPLLDIFTGNVTEIFEDQETNNSEQRNVKTIDNECLKRKKLWVVLSHIFVAVVVPQNS